MNEKTTTSKKCMNPACENTASSRGLCHSCYGQASKLVRDKTTTWKALEEAGKCLPPQVKGPTKKWLMGDSRP